MNARVLYLVVCAAGPATRVGEVVRLAHSDGWSVHCFATASAVEHFLDVPALTDLTGHQVRTTYSRPGDEPLPRADAVVVAPATYNTINKWAAGIADNYVLNQLAELTGLGARIVVLPFVNRGLAANQVFLDNIETLRQAGVVVLFGPREFEPHPPRTGGTVLDAFPWGLALRRASAENSSSM
jgi:phosphopantothenoylcysteine synthetase/decarboxylase